MRKLLIVGLGLLGAAGLAYLGLQYASSAPKLTVARTAAENTRLAQLLPEARAFALALIKRAAQLGIRVLVGETYRDDTRQQQLYIEGKTAIQSAGWHGFRRAFHLVPWDDQMNRWDSAGRRVDLYTVLGIAARKLGGTWFGDKDIMGPKGPFRDLAHFEYRAGTTLATLRTQAKISA